MNTLKCKSVHLLLSNNKAEMTDAQSYCRTSTCMIFQLLVQTDEINEVGICGTGNYTRKLTTKLNRRNYDFHIGMRAVEIFFFVRI
jgi:hypothetical protein